MQQLNENLLILQPGDIFQETYNDALKIYLSGSLSLDNNKLPWQQKFINGLAKMTVPHPEDQTIPDYSMFKFLIFNPLIPSNGEPTIDNPEYVQKIQWEIQGQTTADVIFCNFLKRSTKLSAIQDFLLWAQSGKVVTRIPIESVFYPTINVLSKSFNIPCVGDTGSVIEVMQTIFTQIPKFNELAQFGL